MKFWYELKRSIKSKNPLKKTKQTRELFKNKNKMPWNIYQPGVEFGEHIKKFHIINFILKYKILVPSLLIVRKLFNKYLDNEVPDEPYLRNFKVFEKVFEQSIWDWKKHFIYSQKGTPKPTKKELEKDIKSHSAELLRTMKMITLTFALNDTAYRAFFDILMYNIARGMNKEYEKEEKIKHLFYLCKSVFDIDYYVLEKSKDRNQTFEKYKKEGKVRMV